MTWKKIFCGLVAASMIFSASTLCFAANDSANVKLAKIEIDTYGAEQSGAILDRISKLEKSFSGRNMTGNMNARIEAIYETLYDNSAEPGILAKLNVLEWNLNHKVALGGINSRLIALENQIMGKPLTGTFNDRIRTLSKASYGAEILPIERVKLPANMLIKVVTTAPVSAKTLQVGDVIPVKVVSDIFIDGNLVFANGLPGEGVITRIVRAKNIFSNGKIETDFNKLKSLDGQDVPTFTGDEATEEMLDKSMARGLSLIGRTFSGKSRDVEEVFIRGKNIELPAGIELYVQIKEPFIVYGLRSGGGGYVAPVVEKPVAPSPEPKLVVEKPTETPKKPTETYPGLDPDDYNLKPEEVEPRPEEGKTLEGYDGELIEIVDEE